MYVIVNTGHGPFGPIGLARGECYVAGDEAQTYGDLKWTREVTESLSDEHGHTDFKIFELVEVKSERSDA